MTSADKAGKVDFSWIGTAASLKKEATPCLTDRTGEWSLGYVVRYDERTQRAELFVPYPQASEGEDSGGLTFDVTASLLLPLPAELNEEPDGLAPLSWTPSEAVRRGPWRSGSGTRQSSGRAL